MLNYILTKRRGRIWRGVHRFGYMLNYILTNLKSVSWLCKICFGYILNCILTKRYDSCSVYSLRYILNYILSKKFVIGESLFKIKKGVLIMLTKYKDSVFNAQVIDDTVRIWKYVPIDGFTEVKTRRGTFYEKIVNIDEIESFFTVIFYVYNNEKRFIVKAVRDECLTASANIEIICEDEVDAKIHGFYEMEHGIWCKKDILDNYNRFEMIKCQENSNIKKVTELNKYSFLDAWKVYVKEVET